MSIHFHPLTIKDIRRETPECVSIAFEIPEALAPVFQFTAGQNITIKATINGEDIRRSYSICSSPMENELRVAVKMVAQGKFSSHANEQLKVGDVVEVLPPTGKFTTPLRADQSKNYVAFAAGSGITPILSIIKTILATEPGSQFTLVYGNRSRASIIFKEELEALKNRYMNRLSIYHVLSRERMDADINYGRIDAAKCEQLSQHLIDLNKTDEFFICGPEALIFDVRDFLVAKNIPENKIHFELFTTPGQRANAASLQTFAEGGDKHKGKQSRVSITLDGTTFDFDLPFDSESILDAALRQGADLPYACKGGVCCTCRAKLVEGEVEMDVNYALEKDEVEAGYILTCQSHPRSEKVVVNYDIK